MNGWFPSINASGRIVSGASDLWLDGQQLGIQGWNAKWISPWAFVCSAGPDGLFRYDITTAESSKLDGREFFELTAGGDRWAGTHAPGGYVATSWGPLFRGCGQPSLSSDGYLVMTAEDNAVVRDVGGFVYARAQWVREPSTGTTHVAWGQDGSRVYGAPRLAQGVDLTIAGPEYRPVVIDTPEGPWLLTMTQDGLRLRAWGADMGYTRKTGEDNNLNASAAYVQGDIRVAYQDARGGLYVWEQELRDPRLPFRVATPVPIPPVTLPEPEPEPMPELPESLLEDVQRTYDHWSHDAPLTPEQCAEILMHVAWENRAAGWGLSRKTQGHFANSPVGPIAYDILHHKPSDTLWDCLGPSENPKPLWGQAEPHNDPARVWVAPVNPLEGDQGDPGDENDAPQPDASLLKQIEDLRAEVRELRAAVRSANEIASDAVAEVVGLSNRVLALETKPLPRYVVRAVDSKGVPALQTSRNGWHSHEIRLVVVPE